MPRSYGISNILLFMMMVYIANPFNMSHEVRLIMGIVIAFLLPFFVVDNKIGKICMFALFILYVIRGFI